MAVVVIAIVALGAGAVGGYWVPKRLGLKATSAGTSGTPRDSEATAGADEQWYTCGMHPNVLQRGPGDCPICQMKLTPLKTDGDSGGGGAAGGPTERKVLYWRAPMNPNYISQKPGKSPMGMDLVPVYADVDESPSPHNIRIDPVTIQNMGIRTAVIARGRLVKTIRTVGRVDYDEQLVAFVDTKFNGWIEKLYVDETGQQVGEGDRLFDVYSPELYAAQQEYLSALQNLPLLEKSTLVSAREDAAKMVDASVTKLKYLDVSDKQIEALRRTETIEKTLTIHSPSSGIVTEKMALEGMYVKPGMRLFTIADLSRVWVYVDVYEYQLPWIGVGQQASMTLPYIPGEKFVGKVVYVYPYLEEQTRVIKVRLEFENPALELKPGMYANIRLESELKRDAILIPREAYIDSGTRQVAFVDLGGGKFAPRDIQVGVEAENDMVEVLYGLDEGEVVVTSGQFMLDAESKLKEAVAKMMEAERSKTTKRATAPKMDMEMDMPGADGDKSGKAGETATMSMPPDAAYACPMETHPDEEDPADRGPYFSAEPGKCPRCGMTLEPIDEFAWAQKYRGGAEQTSSAASTPGTTIPEAARYACPMEEHPNETNPADQGPYFSEAPGKCPRCGMKLKPLDDLDWVKMRRAAEGGDVAYTCPDHQHVFADKPGQCPRCGRDLSPFKVMYACPNPQHADVVSAHGGNCPRCGRGLAAFRGVWLDEAMAADNVPANPGLADAAAYRCPVHPLVNSDSPGHCTICGAPLEATQMATREGEQQRIPADAKYTCPMQRCWYFSHEPGECPNCGMRLKAIEDVEWARGMERAVSERRIPPDSEYVCSMEEDWYFSSEPGECPKCGMNLRPIRKVRWAREALAAQSSEASNGQYVCPMHPKRIRAAQPGVCSLCGMQLVAESAMKRPTAASEHVAAQMDYIIEHYLELQKLLASDRTAGIASQASALASASQELMKHVDRPDVDLPSEAVSAARKLHAAAVKTTGTSLVADRVTFVDLSAAVRTLVQHARPDRNRWPKLYIYHCPMSKGDWIQAVEDKANPYYGFKMLKCGKLQGIK